MASYDGTDFRLERARRVARRLVECRDLEPPVEIADVVSDYADVEFDSIPGACDAVVVGLDGKARRRPLVVVEESHHERRQRFSLGHELGHILIPGHIGMEFCETARVLSAAASSREREAHAFASEVLVPSRWLAAIVDDAGSVGDVLRDSEAANVSAAAGCLAIHRALPPGSVIALMNGTTVEMALRSPGTIANLPVQDQDLNETAMSRFSADSGGVYFSGRLIRWWSFEQEAELAPLEDDRTASEMLREIVDDLIADPRSRLSVLSSINGIAGWAKGGYREVENPAAMLGRLRSRFAGRDDHTAVVNDARFDGYLARKAEELARKKS